MAFTETAAYAASRQQLATQPIYLVRCLTPGAIASGLEYAFSRDFAGPLSPVAPSAAPLLYVGKIRGNTQTVDLRTGLTSRGALTIELLDKDGLVTAYCSDPGLGLASGLGTGTLTSITAVGDTGGYPNQGTLELVAADGATKERIRYTSRLGATFLGVQRAVDGTTVRVWAAGTPLHNGEQIRPGTRLALYAGYAGLAEIDLKLLGKFEILERALNADRVTWTISIADLQLKAAILVFRDSSQRTAIALGPEHPAAIALRVLLSTGTGANGPYDTLAADNGAGVDRTLVDVAAFERLLTDVPGVAFEFSITSPVSSAIAWVQEQCLAPLSAFIWINTAGQISVKRPAITATAAEAVGSLTLNTLVAFGPWAAGDRDILNVVDVAYDWLQIQIPGDDGQQTLYDYGKRQQYEATKSITKYGRKPVNGTGRPITWQGIRTARSVQGLLDEYAARQFARWADPAPVLEVKTLYTQHHLEVGDIVTVTHPHAPNLLSGLRGYANELMQVVDVRPGFGAEGGMILKLGTMVRNVAPAGDVFGRTTIDLAPAASLAAPENFSAVQLQQNVIFTWKAVAAAASYEIRDGATWDGGKLVATSIPGVSHVLANVLDGSHTYRIRAFRSATDFSPEATALLSTSDNDKERNVTIDRDEVALAFPGTTTDVAFLVELTPDALSNMAGLWFSDLSTRWFSELSTLWWRAAGGLVYETPAVNQGKLETTALLLMLGTKVTDSAQWFDSQAASWFSEHATEWWNDAASPATVVIQISLSTDGVAFGAYQPYVDGASYTFKALKLRVTITPTSPSAWVRIETMRLVMDVPDIIKDLKDFAVGAAGSTISFSTYSLTFVFVPFISVTHKGGTVNKVHIIKNLTTTGFDIELRDKTDALVAGTVDIKIQGF